MIFDFYMPTKLLIGAGCCANLHKEKLPGKKALIVTSSGSSPKKSGALDAVTSQLEKAGVSYVIFNKILSNPIKQHVMEGAQIAKSENCDFIVGLGGGSSIDSAKAIAIMAANEGDYWDYVCGGSAKGNPIPNKAFPIVAVTTTAGTGTDADRWTVITNEATNEKIGFGTLDTFPCLSVVDANFMTSVPPILTAYQGFDTLFHCTEGFLANIANPLSDIYTLKAIEIVGKYLPKAVKNGEDIDAREKIAFANTLGGFAQTASTCISKHAIAHGIGALFPNIQHGAALVMICEEYYKHLIEIHACDDRFIKMAKALGKKDAASPMDFVDILHKLIEDCGVANLKMSDFGIKQEDLPVIAENAIYTMGGLFECDPVKLTKSECIAILQKSYK